MKRKYDVAAYVWPAYTGDEPRTRMFLPEGIGEWRSVKKALQTAKEYLDRRGPVPAVVTHLKIKNPIKI